MQLYRFLNEGDIKPLGEAVLDVLERVGVLCQNRELLEAMAAQGAKVDFERETALFPRVMCRELLEQIRREEAAKPAAAAQPRPFDRPGLAGFGTQIAQFVYDYGTGERRQGNSADFIQMIKLGSVLHPESSVGHSLLLTDVPPLLEPLEAAMLLAEYAPRPAPAFAWNVRQIDYLIEMGEILGISGWFSWGAICFAHPLRFDKDVADKFVRRVKAGCATGLTAMPVAGVSTPITTAGFIAVAAAEIVATWLAARVINPTVPLGGSIWPGSLDMHTGAVSYCSYDSMHYGFCLAEFLREWTGKELILGGGEYCDARQPGYYAAMEKAYKAMTIAAVTGQHPAIGQGMLEEGKTLCPVQLLLEREMGLGLQIFSRPVEVSSETVTLDSIVEVGFGLTKNYLDSEATLTSFRQYSWCPEVMDRSGWNGHKTDEVVLDRLQQKVDDLLAQYEQPAKDSDKLAAMRKVVDRARKDFCG